MGQLPGMIGTDAGVSGKEIEILVAIFAIIFLGKRRWQLLDR